MQDRWDEGAKDRSKAYHSRSYRRAAFPRPYHSCGTLRKGAAPKNYPMLKIADPDEESAKIHTSDESTSSSFIDSATAVRLAALLLPAETKAQGKKISGDLDPTFEPTNESSVRMQWKGDPCDGAGHPRLALL